ncbi:hypothetical protein GCM10023149_04870 [Mucilaginibacter gynuensis]|uniref:Multidrug resistance protein MdtA-like barrel-sandwich hybrid domain-containing protein n=1 Tax=Mucilaginibacter gynuensis TaxID=1302236 RepID=A0ABP8FSW8_9SPHI
MKLNLRAKAHISRIGFFILAALLFSACQSTPPADATAETETETPVKVTSVDNSSLTDYIDLNATATFLQKSYVKATAIGYLQKVNIQPGQYVGQGQLLFVIKTKEAQSIGNTINVLDTTFKFSGVSRIRAAEHGYITQLNHQTGDYVQDGEQLAVISDRASFVFVMQLPYEYRNYLAISQDVALTLPGGEQVTGKVSSFMPAVDSLSQTQGVVIRTTGSKIIPENLVARARIVKTNKTNAASLPKSAVLANETQTDFWVMKLINDTTAVKTPVKKGIETTDKIEILSPVFSPGDKIIITGNYGLADTAKVKIIK